MLNPLYEVLNLQEIQSGYPTRKGNPGIIRVLMFCDVVAISATSSWTGNLDAQQGVEFGVVSEVSVLCLALLPPAGLGIAVNFILF